MFKILVRPTKVTTDKPQPCRGISRFGAWHGHLVFPGESGSARNRCHRDSSQHGRQEQDTLADPPEFLGFVTKRHSAADVRSALMGRRARPVRLAH